LEVNIEPVIYMMAALFLYQWIYEWRLVSVAADMLLQTLLLFGFKRFPKVRCVLAVDTGGI